VTFTVDTTAPTVTVTTPGAGSVTHDTTPALGGAAGNAAGDSATVTARIYSGTGTGGTLLQTIGVTRSGTSWSATAAALGAGSYTVQAQQTDAAGNSGLSAPVSFTVDTSSPNSPPVASFGFSPASPVAEAEVLFDGSGSHDADGTIQSWSWEFGDGATGSGPMVSHAYALAGTYNAQLTVTDDGGAQATSAQPVTVAPVALALPQPQPQEPQPQPQAQPQPTTTPAPKLSVRVAAQRLATVLRRGLRLTVTSNRAGRADLKLVLSKRAARKLHIGRTIAQAHPTLRASTPAKLRLKLTRSARAALAHRRGLSATLHAAIGVTALTQHVALRR
jgi:PKD repeat protein